MGLLNRAKLHIMDKAFSNQARGFRLGRELAEGAPDAVKFGSIFIGTFCGSIYGGIQLINPLAIADSLLSSEKDLEDKIQKAADKAYGGDL